MQAGGLGGSIDSVAEPLASPTIHKQREQLVEDVVIEPATAGALVRLVGEQRPLDLKETAWCERMSEIEDQEIVDEQIA